MWYDDIIPILFYESTEICSKANYFEALILCLSNLTMLFSGPDRTADEIGLNELHQTVIVEGRTNKNRGKACILDASRTKADLRELIQGFPDTKNFESWANN